MAIFSIDRPRGQSRAVSPIVAFFFGFIFPWPFILFGGSCIYFGLHHLTLARASSGWPQVSGTVQSSNVEWDPAGDDSAASAKVVYTYNVQGRMLTASEVSFGEYGSSAASHADSIVSQYPPGGAVTVYYDPADPSIAVLRPGSGWISFLVPWFGGLFLLLGLGLLIILPRTFFRNTF